MGGTIISIGLHLLETFGSRTEASKWTLDTLHGRSPCDQRRSLRRLKRMKTHLFLGRRNIRNLFGVCRMSQPVTNGKMDYRFTTVRRSRAVNGVDHGKQNNAEVASYLLYYLPIDDGWRYRLRSLVINLSKGCNHASSIWTGPFN